MSKPNPFKQRQARTAAQGKTLPVPGQQSAAPAPTPAKDSEHSPSPASRPFAQGRPEKMMTLADLPEPIETPDATGDLSDEEEQILALCMRGIRQFEDAWWVMGKAMANINNRRLYRKSHATFEAFAREVFKKSRPTAYEEMTSYAIGELMSARADIPSIGKKAAGALNPITKDYGPETSVAVHETIKDATGQTVTVKAITGIVQQLPRKEDKELSQDELTALVRELAAYTQHDQSQQAEDAQASALENLRSAVTHLDAARRALAPARVKAALEEDAEEAAKVLASARDAASKAAARASNSLPKST